MRCVFCAIAIYLLNARHSGVIQISALRGRIQRLFSDRGKIHHGAQRAQRGDKSGERIAAIVLRDSSSCESTPLSQIDRGGCYDAGRMSPNIAIQSPRERLEGLVFALARYAQSHSAVRQFCMQRMTLTIMVGNSWADGVNRACGQRWVVGIRFLGRCPRLR